MWLTSSRRLDCIAVAVVFTEFFQGNGHLADFDHSGIFPAGMVEVPRRRAQAVRGARRNGETLGLKVKPGGSRPLQPVVNPLFSGLNANRLEIYRLSRWWDKRMVFGERPLLL